MDEMRGLKGLEIEPEDLSGRSVLVTGGSMGIGLVCVDALLEAGARVVIAARGADALAEAAGRLRGAHGEERVHAVQADVSRAGDAETLVEEAVERLGGLDGLVHAAAVLGPIGPMLDTPPDEWARTIEVNLVGTYRVVAAVGKAMRSAGGGRMVLFSGGGATSPFPNYSAYAASKAAVVRLAETLAVELAPHAIQVNALAPGFVATRMHDETLAAGERAGAEYLRRTRQELESGGVPPELAARAVVFLLSERAAGITGRLVAAPWDAWWAWPEHREELEGADLFTLRRIVPRDRGVTWP